MEIASTSGTSWEIGIFKKAIHYKGLSVMRNPGMEIALIIIVTISNTNSRRETEMKKLLTILCGLLILASSGVSYAATLDILTLDPLTPPRSGGFGLFRQQSLTLGTFDFDPPGVITSPADIFGTWSGRIPWWGHFSLYLGDTKVADIGGSNFRLNLATWRRGGATNSWSHTFSAEELVALNEDFQDASVDFRIVGRPWALRGLRLGETTLTFLDPVNGNENGGGTAPVPEPATLLLLGSGLLGLAGLRRKFKK